MLIHTHLSPSSFSFTPRSQIEKINDQLRILVEPDVAINPILVVTLVDNEIPDLRSNPGANPPELAQLKQSLSK